MLAIKGISEEEALRRRHRGQGNDFHFATSRTYQDILRRNVFVFINIVLFAIGLVLLVIGRLNDAIVSVGIISMNIIIGVFQEVRAKRQLDRIALLTRPKVTLLREGQEKAVDPSKIVVGDLVRVRPGDQIVVDGVVIGEGTMEIDESLLTGESDLIRKHAGDLLLSGSYCVSGDAFYEVTRVGAECYANQLTTEARSFRTMHTPLQKDIDVIIRLLTALSAFIGLPILISALMNSLSLARSAQMAAVIAGLVPNGLFLMVVVAYAMGALRIVGYGALIQQANSVESLSNVNVLCMDKTGTLTANRIHFHDLLPLGMDRKDIEKILGDFARSASGGNRTTEALLDAFGGQKRAVIEEIPFSSERKWSALVFDDDSAHGAYVLGALEMLQPHLVPGFDVSRQTAEWTAAGLRVLLFAHQPHKTSLFDSGRQPDLPPDLSPLCVLSFRDELRPALKDTLEGFANAGIELKVISGDDPQTVRSLARQAGLPGDMETVVSGLDLDNMDTDAFARAAGEYSIFGRIRPSQKERLVEVLCKQGQYVAMIGDGVNDVLSLKKANLGIAMESGSAATRAVADMVLLNDSFSALPPAFLEGQRIVNGMKDILRLFLARALYFSLLIIATAMIGIGFPYVPTHATLVMFLSVGIPTFALALWARPGGHPKRGLIGEVLHFVLPAAITTALFGLMVYTLMYNQAVPQGETGLFSLPPDELNRLRVELEDTDVFLSPDEFDTEAATLAAQTSLTVFTTLSGLILLVFVEPPVKFFVGGDEFSGDRRPTALMMAMLLLFIGIMVVAPLRHFFGLLVLSRETYLMILAAVAGWVFVVRAAWRSRWMERLLQLEPTE